MLDRASLPATPGLSVAAHDAARTSDAPTSPSAFTAFVDALTETGGGTRASRRDDDAPAGTPDEGSEEKTGEVPVDGVPVCPAAPRDPVLQAQLAQVGNDAALAADAAALAIELAAARIRALIAHAAAGGAIADEAGEADTAAEADAAATFSRAALAAAAAAAGIIDGADAQDPAADTGGSTDGSSAETAGRQPQRSTAASPIGTLQAAIARLTGEGEPAAKKTIESAIAAAFGTHTTQAENTALKTMAAHAPWATITTAIGAAGHAELLSASPALASAVTEVPTTDTGQQIVQAMRLQWANGVGEARIALEPNHFGEVNVSLRVEQGQVFARVQAELPAVREWLQTNQGWLRQSLSEQGLTLGRIEITEPAGESNHDERRESRREGKEQPPARKSRQLLPGEIFEVVA